jgi:hypothetical protein
MKKWSLKYRFFFLPIVSLCLILFSPYALFYTLEMMDNFRKPHWERPFQQGLSANITKRWIGAGPFIWPFRSFQEKDLLSLFSPYSLNFLLPKEDYVLRR